MLVNIHFISLIFHLTVIYSFKDVLGMFYDYIFATFYQMCCISCKQHDVCVVIIEVNTVHSFGLQREHMIFQCYFHSIYVHSLSRRQFMRNDVSNSRYGLNLYC